MNSTSLPKEESVNINASEASLRRSDLPSEALGTTSVQKTTKTLPLTKATLAWAKGPSSFDEAEKLERISRAQKAGAQLGFDLSPECFESPKWKLEEWLCEQCHRRNTNQIEKGEGKSPEKHG